MTKSPRSLVSYICQYGQQSNILARKKTVGMYFEAMYSLYASQVTHCRDLAIHICVSAMREAAPDCKGGSIFAVNGMPIPSPTLRARFSASESDPVFLCLEAAVSSPAVNVRPPSLQITPPVKQPPVSLGAASRVVCCSRVWSPPMCDTKKECVCTNILAAGP